jgi:hypothetical protein
MANEKRITEVASAWLEASWRGGRLNLYSVVTGDGRKARILKCAIKSDLGRPGKWPTKFYPSVEPSQSIDELAIRSASESLASMITLFSMVLACSPIPRKALLQDLRAELDEACVGAIYAHIRCEPQHANPMNLSPH